MRLFAFLTLTFLTSAVFAQHGIAPSGKYPVNYKMDTWTGKLIAYDPDTHVLKLECDICAQHEAFEGVLGDPNVSKTTHFKVAPRDSGKREVRGTKMSEAPDTITIGDVLKVYYVPLKHKQDGKKVNYNAVFAMETILSMAPPNTGN